MRPCTGSEIVATEEGLGGGLYWGGVCRESCDAVVRSLRGNPSRRGGRSAREARHGDGGAGKRKAWQWQVGLDAGFSKLGWSMRDSMKKAWSATLLASSMATISQSREGEGEYELPTCLCERVTGRGGM
jgi:hypothetical protein